MGPNTNQTECERVFRFDEFVSFQRLWEMVNTLKYTDPNALAALNASIAAGRATLTGLRATKATYDQVVMVAGTIAAVGGLNATKWGVIWLAVKGVAGPIGLVWSGITGVAGAIAIGYRVLSTSVGDQMADERRNYGNEH